MKPCNAKIVLRFCSKLKINEDVTELVKNFGQNKTCEELPISLCPNVRWAIMEAQVQRDAFYRRFSLSFADKVIRGTGSMNLKLRIYGYGSSLSSKHPRIPLFIHFYDLYLIIGLGSV